VEFISSLIYYLRYAIPPCKYGISPLHPINNDYFPWMNSSLMSLVPQPTHVNQTVDSVDMQKIHESFWNGNIYFEESDCGINLLFICGVICKRWNLFLVWYTICGMQDLHVSVGFLPYICTWMKMVFPFEKSINIYLYPPVKVWSQRTIFLPYICTWTF
jgi:hypothetical protein